MTQQVRENPQRAKPARPDFTSNPPLPQGFDCFDRMHQVPAESTLLPARRVPNRLSSEDCWARQCDGHRRGLYRFRPPAVRPPAAQPRFSANIYFELANRRTFY